MTNFTSQQYNITEKNLSNAFNGSIESVEDLRLYDVSISPSGHGHYKIEAIFYINDEKLQVTTKTSNMPLIDAYKSGMQDLFEDGENGFDNWDEVAETMLSVIDAEDEINELVYWNE